MNQPVIEAVGLTKTYGTTTVLDHVGVEVPRGTVLGLLGHNGAGKTTLVNILTTTLPATSGTARVAGHDVAARPAEVRRRIGVTGQFASVDEGLSAIDNLVLIARLLGAGRRQAAARATELVELFDLVQAARKPARTYSGGMRRRLDLAAGLVGNPEVIFLDEPTTGLDPAARLGLWEVIEDHVRQGATVLLTTQYLEEADRLADSITLLSAGRVVASGTPDELKSRAGKRSVTVTLDAPDLVPAAVAALRAARLAPAHDERTTSVTVPVEAARDVATVVRALDEHGIDFTGLSVAEPTLDDVYLTYAHRPSAAAA
ncbi:ATP-binding cassette domain-containing protein [Streptomyces mangrovisoli]|uniref:Daunorubicin/doxorubicin resistance ABC transporter ATP-binding protein DrrA n=1 Tax=Streptomyces mangrovisoli TaxID=1428628 RepID=A0A1J4P0D6_9ACTN|nr:ATP-binding cassette domain-containing protein [Streptomyces mangrovisoli]OIJ68207.1 daunorubicin/doxorubicin resistance ABC transporter ATP-binding protein DrrA [Streptomyces mangrovisoli]